MKSPSSIFRALALGAHSCMIGRSYVYGLGAGGEEGVGTAIAILARELDVAMALTGIKRVREIDKRIITQ